ncbi:MAG: hypothetical protein H0T62_08755 [Parachlamydiaceae bacterium]|nr:hypothetical protein [Parachlamydiaceae bacterium]
MMRNRCPFYLDGALNIRLDDNPIKMECEGRFIKLTFTSFYGMGKFIRFKRSLNHMIDPFTQKNLETIDFKYYLDDALIGESNEDLPASFVGRYIGLKKTKFYVVNALKQFFKKGFSTE